MAQTKMRAKPKTKRENLGRRRSSASNPQARLQEMVPQPQDKVGKEDKMKHFQTSQAQM